MEQTKIFKHSFENSKRLIEQSRRINRVIEDFIYDGLFESRKEATKRINDLLYETATKMGISLYDLCFRTMPEEELVPHSDPKFPNIEVAISLKPVEFELEQGPGYWKGKYYNLKKKMQEIIDNNEI